MKCSHISSASSLVRRNGRNQGEIFLGIYPKKKREQWCLQVCVPKCQRQQPTVHLCLHWYAHRPLTLACDISLQTSWIDLVKRCGCFFLLDSRYSPLAEVMPVYILSEYCSNLPLKNRPMRYFRLLVRVSLLTLFLRYYADIILSKCLFGLASRTQDSA